MSTFFHLFLFYKSQIYKFNNVLTCFNQSAFPNYEVDKTHDNPLENSHQIELEIARNCQNVKSMILDLDAHQKRQISEMEKDLAFRQEKHLGIKTIENSHT